MKRFRKQTVLIAIALTLACCSGLLPPEAKSFPEIGIMCNYKLTRADISFDHLTEEEKKDKAATDLARVILLGRYKQARLKLFRDSTYFFNLDKVSGAGEVFRGKWYLGIDSLDNYYYVLEKAVLDSAIQLKIMGDNNDSLSGTFNGGGNYVMTKCGLDE